MHSASDEEERERERAEGSVFAVSGFYQLTGSQLSWLVLSELVVLPGEP